MCIRDSTETARAIFGADKKDSGQIFINGKEVTVNSPMDAVKHGIGYLSEDRKRYGIIVEKSVADNSDVYKRQEEDCVCPTDEKEELGAKNMLLLAVATSIDALAVGVTFAFLKVQIIPAVSFIGIITFSLSAAGVKIGNVFGVRYKSKAELAGGIILILMGTKILLEHLGVF